MAMKRSESITNFLKMNTTPDLYTLYSPEMEVQVMVGVHGGEKITGEHNGKTWWGYTDGLETWKNFRIDNPLADTNVTFDISKADYIGLSGWDFVQKQSRWVVFDFDAIVGHSSRHTRKMSFNELEEVRRKASEIPWVTIRRSTSGNGLHLYVHVDQLTETRAHHAALARAILSEMSRLCGFEFDLSVDVCGGMAWVWASRQAPNAFEILKEATAECPELYGWESHLDVTTRKRRHTYDDDIRDIVLYKNDQQLDDQHQQLIDWLQKEHRFWFWNAEVGILITHTCHLRDAHRELGLKGMFETISEGTDLNTQNCFAHPLPEGSWMVYRYGRGTQEHESWVRDHNNFTRTPFNQNPSFEHLCKVYGAEDEKGRYHMIGREVNKIFKYFELEPLDDSLANASIAIGKGKDKDKIILEMKVAAETHLQGWINKNKTTLLKVYNLKERDDKYKIDNSNFVRHIITLGIGGGQDGGWVVNADSVWIDEPLQHVKYALGSKGLDNNAQNQTIGQAIMNPWKVVIRPFEEEYLGNRVWNRAGSQFRHTPHAGTYDMWMNILSHVGKSLDDELRANDWFQQNGIQTGYDYLFAWVAAMFQYPYEHLPFLFIYSEKQSTGKSLFHESLNLLFDPGVTRAETALSTKNDFNGELEGAVLCVVEEVNLNRPGVYDRIKDYVTSKTISIHTKQKTPRTLPNTTHWIQTGNDLSYCPVFKGDTRITIIEVPEPPEKILPKRMIFEELEKQAPAFLHALLDYRVPPMRDRLMLPTIDSAAKELAYDINLDEWDRFVRDRLVEAPGYLLKFSEIYEAFQIYLNPEERGYWSRKRVSSLIRFPKGRLTNDSSIHIGNVAWSTTSIEDRPSYHLDAGVLKTNV